jgi:RHH-type proline utilization regulon transcriptional repressor/proline dehydrogenase/delta 1-pyrroline-5-carboxylate dehydrogenase
MASSDRELRAALFRFVDVVPACRSLDDLARHLVGFLEEVPETPPPLSVAMKMSGTRAGRAALGAAAAGGVRHLAHRFIVGETPNAALGTLRKLWERGVASSVDLLGEATVTESEADRYAARCLEAIEQLSAATRGWPSRETLETDGIGPLPRANVCVKVSALTPLLRPDAASAMPPGACGPCCAPPGRPARTCTSTWSPWTPARRCWTWCSTSWTRTSSARGPRPDSCSRPTCATRPIRPGA